MKIYTELAEIYNEICPSLTDYQKEYEYYSRFLNPNDFILELGCGTGKLAKYFLENNYRYLGMDLHEPMLEIARDYVSNGNFIKGDIRNFRLHQQFDIILITGSTFAHLLTNQDVIKCLETAYATLKPGGLLIFDNVNAKEFLAQNNTHTSQKILLNDKSYTIESHHQLDLLTGFSITTQTKYIVTHKEIQRIFQDQITWRAFTVDELEIFIHLTKLQIIGIEIPPHDPHKIITITVKNVKST